MPIFRTWEIFWSWSRVWMSNPLKWLSLLYIVHTSNIQYIVKANYQDSVCMKGKWKLCSETYVNHVNHHAYILYVWTEVRSGTYSNIGIGINSFKRKGILVIGKYWMLKIFLIGCSSKYVHITSPGICKQKREILLYCTIGCSDLVLFLDFTICWCFMNYIYLF